MPDHSLTTVQTDTPAQYTPEQLREHIVAALSNTKAEDIDVLDVRSMTDIADFMVICSGTSDRHVQAIARNAQTELADLGIKPMSSEGEEQSDWVLVDYIDVLVHIMKRDARAFYDLDGLWSDKFTAASQDIEQREEA